MTSIHQKPHSHLLLLLVIISISISCHLSNAAENVIARKIQETYPEPSVEYCDTCPEPLPPPPPPPLLPECPPPPPPPCPPPPPPPEEPCSPCMEMAAPPPPLLPYIYTSTPSNLYATEYNSGGALADVVVGLLGIGLALMLEFMVLV